MTTKYYDIDDVQKYAGHYKNEITGLYLSLWMTTTTEADIAESRAEHFRQEYLRCRLAELKEMPYKDYLQTGEWNQRRKEALSMAEYKCQVCDAKDVILNVHHKTYERRGEELPEDLVVLCEKCHAKFHEIEDK